jgi:hypothetical protein
MPAGSQLIPEVCVIVDLAVEHHMDGPVLVGHRLTSTFRIDDPEAAYAQRDVTGQVHVAFVGTPVPERVRHRPDCRETSTCFLTAHPESGNSTHRMIPAEDERTARRSKRCGRG